MDFFCLKLYFKKGVRKWMNANGIFVREEGLDR